MYQPDHLSGPFTFRQSGRIGQEILDGNGIVVCWTTSEVLAALIVHLLNHADGDGLTL